MGRIKKSATDKHDMALSPYIADFVSRTTKEPLHKLPAHLATFPQIWGFPRGDLYHWIPVLNRFDHILALFVAEYSLYDGPQTKSFGDALLKRGDGEKSDEIAAEVLEQSGYSVEGDREVVQAILRFSLVLLEHNGNRSLYSSSEYLNNLLNTTSLPLLKANLQLCLGLAQRFWSSKSRLSSSHQLSALLQSHFNINLDKLQATCEPFSKGSKPSLSEDGTGGKSSSKEPSDLESFNSSNLNLLLKAQDLPEAVKESIGDIYITFYDRANFSESASQPGAPAVSPSSPTPARRTVMPHGNGTNIAETASTDRHDKSTQRDASAGPQSLHIAGKDVATSSPEAVVRDNIDKLPTEYQYALLQQVRVAQGFRGTKQDLQDLICVRMYALANLAYVYGENTFHGRIGQADSQQSRDLQLASQLADLLQPNTGAHETIPLEISIAAVTTLEALSKVKSKSSDVAAALNISVSHGILFYTLRKILVTLESNDVDAEQFKWREAVFTLVTSIAGSSTHSYHRNTDLLVAAGLIGVLVQGLTLRTANAEPHYGNILHFFDTFIHNGVRESFPALINARGLKTIADLTSYEVTSALEAASTGQGLPDEYKTKVTDYQIPFYKQQALRRIFKFIHNLFGHSVGGGDRHLRNLIDSPQLLGALKSIIGNANVFGSNVWIGAVNIITSFIHGEPTSYNVIHEAGLSTGILDAIAPTSTTKNALDGILPVGETLRDIPPAFGAICLNEHGMKAFQDSDAVNSFLSVFTSLDHVKAMQEDDCAIAIGTSFDELVRHHPELKDKVHEAVMRMVQSVVSYCRDRAKEKGIGAKLWIPGPDDKMMYVAGGKQAMLGPNFGVNDPHEMNMDLQPLSEKDVEHEKFSHGLSDGRSTSDVIGALSKFLQGYLSNTTMLGLFCEAGGVARMIDLAMCPCNPWNFHDQPAYEELAKVFLHVVESKPHMVLPPLVSRTKHALSSLQPFMEHEVKTRFFGEWTSFGPHPSVSATKSLQSGTSLVKSLVTVQTMINLLADIFQFNHSYYNSRSTYPNYFHQVNLTDFYISLVDALGRLHTVCIWEEIHLQESMPEKWKEQTRVRGIGFDNAEADLVMGQITTRRASQDRVESTNTDLGTITEGPATSERSGRASNEAIPEASNGLSSSDNVVDGSVDGTDDSDSGSDESEDASNNEERSLVHPAAFLNIEALRYLLSQLPIGIISLFQQLGKSLFLKGRGAMDVYQKQGASLLADHVSKALITQLQDQKSRVESSPAATSRYEIVVLSSLIKIIADKPTLRANQPDILLIILRQFYRHGGLEVLNKSLEKWLLLKLKLDKEHDETGMVGYATAGASMILDFYSKITTSKIIHESQQATSLSSPSSNSLFANHFDPAQLLVELRDAVILQVLRVWADDYNDDLDSTAIALESDTIRSMITVLRSTLESEGELRAFTREQAPPEPRGGRLKWRTKQTDGLKRMIEGGASQQLAIEALFRCNENLSMAIEYCKMRQHADAQDAERLPPPPEELDNDGVPQSQPTTSFPAQASEASASSQIPSVEMQDAEVEDQNREVTDEIMSDVDASADSGSSLNNLASRTSGALHLGGETLDESVRAVGELPSHHRAGQSSVNQTPSLPLVTKEDLDEKRKKVREDLVDRCLEYLNENPDLTFDISDLISSATSGNGAESKELKESFGETLILTLVSLRSSDDTPQQYRKIAAMAHLLALILQDQGFFDASVDSLKTNFDEFVQLMRVPPEANIEEATGYITHLLLVMERILVEDEQPHQIPRLDLNSLSTSEPAPIPLPPPLIEQHLKESLLNVILEMLPRVARNEIFALSITRVLVILTRRRTIAKRLSEKPNLGRLFLMVKQLAGMTNEKLQASFMIVLRHMVEDEHIIRQIMLTEIQLAFENNRSSRPLDTTNYVRNLYYLVIRDPEMFVQLTNEKVKLHRYDGSSRPSPLTLKKEESAAEAEKTEEAVPSTEKTVEAFKPPFERTKTSELKPPSVENPDGVIQFLMKELTSYKDVEDKESASAQRPATTEQPSTPDVDMTDTATPPPDGPPITATLPTFSKSHDRAYFKTEDHPIFTYRCHLLQFLVELLSSYNHTKVEFINFSSRNESLAFTPSKPRSGFLNYLLTSLIPVGTLAHADDINHRKKIASSHCATSVVVALCTKTHERAVRTESGPNSSYEDEPDLTYVRKFVLEQALKAFNTAVHSTYEPVDRRYARLLGLSELFNRMLSSKANGVNNLHGSDMVMTSAKHLCRLMYEKNFVSALTASIAEIDLNFPKARRAVKYILRPLELLTSAAVELSLSASSTSNGTTDDDDISSATSVSDEDENHRHATPDIFRNSTLGQFEAGREEDSESSDGDDEDEEGYYGEEYDEDEMDYEDDRPIPEHGDVVSDDDEELGGMGPIEGMPGDVNMDHLEIVMGGGSDDESESDSEDDDDDDDDDDESDEDEGMDDHDDIEIVDEMTEDGDNESEEEGDHDHEDGWEDDDDNPMLTARPPMDAFSSVLSGHADGSNLMAHFENAELDAEFLDDEMPPEDEDVEVEDYEEDNLVYEPEVDMDEDDEDDGEDEGWGYSIGRAPAPFYRRSHGIPRIQADHWPMREGHMEAFPTMRAHRGNGASRGVDDGTNPLLQRNDPRAMLGHRNDPWGDMLFAEYTGSGMPGRAFGNTGDLPPFMADLLQMVGQPVSTVNIVTDRDMMPRRFGPYVITGTPGSMRDTTRGTISSLLRGLRPHNGPLSSRLPTHDPGAAVTFMTCPTSNRWQDEARILFGQGYNEKCTRVVNSILRLLTPPAIEAKRQRDQTEAERKAAEDKAREEREAKEAAERKEREELARRELEERQAREAAEIAQQTQDSEERVEPTTSGAAMDGVEQNQPAAVNTASEIAEPVERITAIVRGSEVDITNLGIDPAFLEEIPAELREDVIMQQLQSRVTVPTEAAAASRVPDEIDRDFLNILPHHIQQELLRAEESQRSRREREARRAARALEDQPVQAEEMNNADFMAMLDPALRQSVLMEADEAILDSLPEEFRAEAQELFGRSGTRMPRMPDTTHARHRERREHVVEQQQDRQKRPSVQILDKAGVAILMRLMFFALQGSARSAMMQILSSICSNSQTRAEVISILLAILQDGTSDSVALDKSFAQLNMRAKQMSGPKTPQPLRRTLTGPQVSMPSTDTSPLTIVLQSLTTLGSLVHENPRFATFFLTEHETIGGQRTKTPKKGKSKELKAHRYPVNALLSLLDRRTVMDNAAAIELLAGLLVEVTEPLKTLIKRAKEEEKKDQPQVAASLAPESNEISMVDNGAGDSATTAQTSSGQPGEQGEKSKPEEKKKTRDVHPPDIPEENLCLVVNIIAARECSGKTFQNTLEIINHLSANPGARDVFGRELVRRAQSLGAEVLADLQQLPQQIRKAQSSTEMQGLALGAFSPASAHQNKLLRVLLALDYIFDPKRTSQRVDETMPGTLPQHAKDDLISRLYEDEAFIKLWNMLSECLAAIQERGTMSNVATILQPLVEAFMVVCKNTATREMPVASPQEMAESTPPPQNRVESLFFTFTEAHRKILNDLVRQNPKLMNGTFDVLVKNSKVLEFDNKRNFFNKRLHARSTEERVPHQSLQLQVRRSHVFLDSFKALFFKKANEIKYGKLNIRFTDEEGVDAGGVTREWFAAISRQMFDPNYALFNPVAADRTTFHPNELSAINEQHLTFFKFIGRIIGKALYEGRVLDCHFSRAVYKRILGKTVSLKDMETLDLEYYKSLVWMLENDITDVAFETFSVEIDRFGEKQTVDLIPDGRNIPVTEDNKQEYVRLVVEQRLTKSVEEQLEHFLIGFRDIVPLELISIFNEQELELLISGLPDIDVDDWKNNTDYHNYTATSPQVQWFWRAVRSFDKEEKAKLLQFVTGTSKVPLNGFKELEGMNGYNKFNIHRDFGHKERLPTSHTCFNQLDLPEYENYEILRKQMYTAMTVGSDYFGFA